LKKQKENRGEAETRKGAQPAEVAYEIASKAEVRNRFFCFNDPINLMDPEGLSCSSEEERFHAHLQAYVRNAHAQERRTGAAS
jgi:predicted 2-oxoglutarate/Fe(II)-dependent dioxygenase YbiX